jgi:hypothetical protein
VYQSRNRATASSRSGVTSLVLARKRYRLIELPSKAAARLIGTVAGISVHRHLKGPTCYIGMAYRARTYKVEHPQKFVATN